jgi:transcriptional regulator with XRE-family HTH domain
MNEEILNELLRRAIQKGAVPLEFDDEAVDHWLNHETPELPDAIQSNIKRKLKLRLQDAVLQESVESLNEPVAPIGRLISTIRNRAGLSRADVSGRLGKPDEYLKQIEESDATFPIVTPEEFVNLMHILHLTFSKVSETVQRTIDFLEFPNASGWPDAITTGLQNEKNKDHSLTSSPRLLRKSSQVDVSSETKKAAEAWLTNLESELGKRNSTGLFR